MLLHNLISVADWCAGFSAPWSRAPTPASILMIPSSHRKQRSPSIEPSLKDDNFLFSIGSRIHVPADQDLYHASLKVTGDSMSTLFSHVHSHK